MVHLRRDTWCTKWCDVGSETRGAFATSGFIALRVKSSRRPRQHLEQRRATGQKLPLFGIPFAVKDNIDVAGVPTTAACAALGRSPTTHATVVARLLAAGAIYVGKTNLDQLATGLVGVRSPYGIPTNPFNADMIPGGSSSGSAVAVASGRQRLRWGPTPPARARAGRFQQNRRPQTDPRSAQHHRRGPCMSIARLRLGLCADCRRCAIGGRNRQRVRRRRPFSRPDANETSFVGGELPSAFRFGVPQAPISSSSVTTTRVDVSSAPFASLPSWGAGGHHRLGPVP